MVTVTLIAEGSLQVDSRSRSPMSLCSITLWMDHHLALSGSSSSWCLLILSFRLMGFLFDVLQHCSVALQTGLPHISSAVPLAVV